MAIYRRSIVGPIVDHTDNVSHLLSKACEKVKASASSNKLLMDVHPLKEMGGVLDVTGDGTNDALSLRFMNLSPLTL